MEQAYKEELVTLEAEGARLPAALTLPVGQEVRWRVVLIPGSMANDVDGNYPPSEMKPHMYADLARQLAAHGHAVLRYARVGSDTGSVIVDKQQAAEHRLFPQQQYIAVAACEKLRELVPEAKGMALAGHSEGSVHAITLAQRQELGVDALVSLSGPADRYMDLFINMARELSEEQGEIIDFGAFKVNAANYIRVFELMREGRPFTDEIKADPTMAFFVNNWSSDSPEAVRGQMYMRDYDAFDPLVEIARVPCPVLVVQGGLDGSAVGSDNGERLYQARHALYPETTELAFFPDLQHFYKHAEPGMNSMQSMALDGETDARVSASMSEWLDRLR